jgi:hypothetical protein
MYLHCHEYRHRGICEVEDTRVIHKQGKCPDYRDNEDGATGENLERDRSGESWRSRSMVWMDIRPMELGWYREQANASGAVWNSKL